MEDYNVFLQVIHVKNNSFLNVYSTNKISLMPRAINYAVIM